MKRPWSEFQGFVETFRNESDRACAVLGGAVLDSLLENLLRAAMLPKIRKEIFEGQAALSTFSARIDIAYYFGLISEEEAGDLHLVRRIRNDFAHVLDHSLTFSSQTVTNRIYAMRLPKLLYEHPTLRVSEDTGRERFQIAVGMLMYLLSDLRITTLKQAIPPVDFRTLVLEQQSE